MITPGEVGPAGVQPRGRVPRCGVSAAERRPNRAGGIGIARGAVGAIFADELVPMLSLLFLLAAWGPEGVWPPIGLRQLVDSGEHRDSVAPVTNRAAPPRPAVPALRSNDSAGRPPGGPAPPTPTPGPGPGLFRP